MAQVVAVTQIVRNIKPGVAADKAKGTKAIPPQSKTIEPGTLFVSEGDELATLRKARAVRDPEPGEFGERRRTELDDDAPRAKAPAAKTAAKGKGGKKDENADGKGAKPGEEPGDGNDDGGDAGSNLV